MIKDFQTRANENDAHLKQSWMQSQQMGVVNGKAQSEGEPFIVFAQRSYNIWKTEESKKPVEIQEQIHTKKGDNKRAKQISLWDVSICVDWAEFVWVKTGNGFIDATSDRIDIIKFHVLRKKTTLKVWDSIELTKEIVKLYIKDTQDVAIVDHSGTMQKISDITKEYYLVGEYTIKKEIIEKNFNPLTYKEW